MSRRGLTWCALALAVVAGCPPTGLQGAGGPGRSPPKAPAGWKVEGCRLVPDPPPGSATTTECYHAWSWRTPSPLDACGGERELENGLCYPPCRAGYRGDGPVCWRDCPAGYHDDGVTCRRDISIVRAERHGCPWYDVCGVWKGRGCTTCPAGYRNDGCTCVRDTDIQAQDAYGRGVGAVPGCAPGEEQIGLLCYSACPAGTRANGFVCEETAETCSQFPAQPAPPGQTFCFEVRGPGYCGSVELQADSTDNAEALALCAHGAGYTATAIDCAYVTNACR